MTDANTNDADWVRAWIAQQRDQLQRLGALGAATDGAQVVGQLRDIGMRWLDIVGAWHGAWAGVSGAMPRFSEMMEQMPPLGLAREQAQAWRDLAAAQTECQKLEQELRSVLMRVQSDALSLLEQRVRDRESSNTAIDTFRDLYELWVECGETIYAQVAHSDGYAKLQADLGNATIRLRGHQQKIIEHGLKQFDLPTRAELNTVHRQMRELRDKVAALEGQLADPPEGGRQ